jgi:hypothetical protein
MDRDNLENNQQMVKELKDKERKYNCQLRAIRISYV